MYARARARLCVCVRMCLFNIGGRCNIFNVGVVGVCGCVGVVLAVNVKVMESRDMTNAYALNRSQKRCCMMFYSMLSVNSYLCCAELTTCPF